METTPRHSREEEKLKSCQQGRYLLDVQCYDNACELSLQVNFNLLERVSGENAKCLGDEWRECQVSLCLGG